MPKKNRDTLCNAIDAMYRYCDQHTDALEQEGVGRISGPDSFVQAALKAKKFNFDNVPPVQVHNIFGVVKRLINGVADNGKTPEAGVTLFDYNDPHMVQLRGVISSESFKALPMADKIVEIQPMLMHLKKDRPNEYNAMAKLFHIYSKISKTPQAKMPLENLVTVSPELFSCLGLMEKQGKYDDPIQAMSAMKGRMETSKAFLGVMMSAFAEPPKFDINIILHNYSGKNRVAEEYDKLRGFKLTKTDARKEQVDMLQTVINTLNKDTVLTDAKKIAILRCVVVELEKQLDPKDKHNKNSGLMVLVQNLKKQLPPVDEKIQQQDQLEFKTYFQTLKEGHELKENKWCRNLFSSLTVNAHAITDIRARINASMQANAPDKSQTLAFHALFGTEGSVRKEYEKQGKKFSDHFTSKAQTKLRDDQMKFLEHLVQSTAKMTGLTKGVNIFHGTSEYMRLNPTQAQILQGGVNLIKEQLGKHPKGRLAKVLAQMQTSIDSSVAGREVNLSPVRCRKALSTHINDNLEDYKALFDGFGKKFVEAVKTITAPPEPPSRKGRPTIQ